MSDISTRHGAGSSGHLDSGKSGRRAQRRRSKRIALAAAIAVIAVMAMVAGGGYLYTNHVLSSVHRIPVAALNAAHQPVMPAATSRSMTILLTSSTVGAVSRPAAAGSSSGRPLPAGGLIALIHFDASQRTGAMISIPSNLMVAVPGHGRAILGDALSIGGPSLLIKTVERLTNVRIDHYSILSVTGALQVIGALGGVDVSLPYSTTSGSYTFQQGKNHINGYRAIAYARQPGVSEIGRELLQQNLIRSILIKIARQGLFKSPTVDVRLVRAMAGALSVDSNLSNSGLESLAVRLGKLGSGAGTFVNTPVLRGSATRGGDRPVYLNRALSGKLWQAIRHDSVAAFALRYPATVTSPAPA